MNSIKRKKTIHSILGVLVGTLFSVGVIAAQVAAPFTSAARYDLSGKLTGTISPDPDGDGPRGFSAIRNTFNSDGLLEKVESGELSVWNDEAVEPNDWIGFAVENTKVYRYDSYGRKTIQATLNKNGSAERLTQFSYDAESHVDCKVIRMNSLVFNENNFTSLPDACTPTKTIEGYDRVSKYTYNNHDLVETEERAFGTSLQQTYVTNVYVDGIRLETQKDANGNVTKLEYDEYKRLYRRYYPSPLVTGSQNLNDYNQYQYDVNGNLEIERKRNGATITNTYDDNNRLITKNFSNGTYSDIYYDYDLRGLTLSSRFDGFNGIGITNTFTDFGNLETATTNVDGVSRTLTYQYDSNGNRERITHPEDGNPDPVYFGYQFDGMNRVIGLTESGTLILGLTYKSNGGRDTISRSGSSTTYTYDDAARLKTINQDLFDDANDVLNTFTYNSASQITTLNKNNASYNYIGNANRIGTYVPNGLNQYKSVNGSELKYEDSKANLTKDGGSYYAYDDENRLVGVTGSATASLKYDPLGRLYETKINGIIRRYLYDGDALVAEYDGNGLLARRYVHGDQVDEPWVQYNSSLTGAGYRLFLHADHQGSIIAQTDGFGKLLNKFSYDSYGIPANNLDRFGYTGQIWIKSLGLYHYKSRIYSPKLGRFLQTDPIFYADQMNMYAYVGNDPVNRMDPTGNFGVGFQQGFSGQGEFLKQYSKVLTTQMSSAIIKQEIDNSKSSLNGISAAGDIVAVAGAATLQPELVAAGTAIATSATLASNHIEYEGNDATLAQGAGEAAGTAAGNGVKIVGEVVGTMGVKGKIAEGVINATAEAVSQKVSEKVTEQVLLDENKKESFR